MSCLENSPPNTHKLDNILPMKLAHHVIDIPGHMFGIACWQSPVTCQSTLLNETSKCQNITIWTLNTPVQQNYSMRNTFSNTCNNKINWYLFSAVSCHGSSVHLHQLQLHDPMINYAHIHTPTYATHLWVTWLSCDTILWATWLSHDTYSGSHGLHVSFQKHVWPYIIRTSSVLSIWRSFPSFRWLKMKPDSWCNLNIYHCEAMYF